MFGFSTPTFVSLEAPQAAHCGQSPQEENRAHEEAFILTMRLEKEGCVQTKEGECDDEPTPARGVPVLEAGRSLGCPC